jgi:hypothetical protein
VRLADKFREPARKFQGALPTRASVAWATIATVTRGAQLILDLDLDLTPIGGNISSDQHPTRQFHGWLELTAAIDALRTAAQTAPAACGHASASPRPPSPRDGSR